MNAQIKARDEYIIIVKDTIKDNEERYLQHLDTIKREYEKLEAVNEELRKRISDQRVEIQSLRLEAGEARNESAR